MTMPKRYNLLDILRSLALVNMIIYHAMWDVVYIFGTKIEWYTSQAGFVWQQCICYTFILLSGFCWHMSKHKLRHGFVVFACSVLISVVTALFMPKNMVLFGVLSLLGSAAIIMIALDKVLKKLNPYLGFIICVLLFALTRNAGAGEIGLGEWTMLHLPDGIYSNLLTAYLGFAPEWFASVDYFPLIPWLFLYMVGYFMYMIFCKNDWLRFLTCKSVRPAEWLGRHSLVIYMLHQPVIYGVLALVYAVF